MIFINYATRLQKSNIKLQMVIKARLITNFINTSILINKGTDFEKLFSSAMIH